MTITGLRVLTLVLLALALPGHGQDDSKEAQERSRLQTLKDQISALQQRLLNRNSEADQLAAELEKRELAAAAINKRIAALDGDVEQLLAEVAELGGRRDTLQAQSLEQQAALAREINSAYRLGSSEPVKLLLNQEDPQKMARVLQYYRYFAAARREKIDEFQATIDQLVTVEDAIAARRQELLATRQTLDTQLADLKAEQEQRGAVLASINAALGDDQARLAKLNSERIRLEEVIASLEAAIHDLAPTTANAPFPKLKGKLPWPVAGRVTQSYGSFRAQSLKWTGWLISASEGSPVTAVHTGRVAFSDYLRGHGLMLIVDHGDGYLSLYAHNRELLKQVGDWVQAGDRIALAGNSGGLTDSALYFEIRHNGRPQDPKAWLGASR